MLLRCLQKDSTNRLHDIADARIEIKEALTEPSGTQSEAIGERLPSPVWRTLPWVTAGVFALLATAVGIWSLTRPDAPSAGPVTRLRLSIPPLAGFRLALSPDGTRLALVTWDDGTTKLFLRSMEQLDATPMEGTEGASFPFFSPDGEWIGFFADDQLKKVSIAGGAPVTVCDARNGLYASWGPDDRIYFSADSTGRGVSWVSAAGGAPQAATTPNEGEWMHWPLEVLPGGKAVLITVWTQAASSFIGVLSLETGEYRALIEGTTLARYAPTGHLIYEQTGALLAVPFDLGRLEVTGPPVEVVQGLRDVWLAVFALSENGNLVYVPGSGTKERTFVWVNRHGEAEPLTDLRHEYEDFRISPDGQRIATGSYREEDWDIWVYDITRGTLTRLTLAASEDGLPIWTPDGRRVTFMSDRDAGTWNLYWKPADGSGQTERLTEGEDVHIPQSWSPDGRVLAFMTRGDNGTDIWMLPIDGERKPELFLDTPFSEEGAEFSPDGRWIVYVSDETGRPEVYVTPYPGPGGKFLISKDGGVEPLWAPDGTEIFYRTRTARNAHRPDHNVMVVPVRLSPEFKAGEPKVLFEDRFKVGGVSFFRNYDIASDGQRFLMLRGNRHPPSSSWFSTGSRSLNASSPSNPNRSGPGSISATGSIEPQLTPPGPQRVP